jgi:hypothetical protein
MTKTVPTHRYLLDLATLGDAAQIAPIHKAQKLTGENLKVVQVEFSTLS